MGRVEVLPELSQWRDDDEGAVYVCVRTDAEPARAFAVMREVVDELRGALTDPELWSAVPLPSGAGFFVGNSDDDYDEAYETIVGVTRRRLELAGLSGQLYPFDTMADRNPLWAVPPIDFLHCYVTLPGHGVENVKWRAPLDVVVKLLDFAVRWCQWGDAVADVHITVLSSVGYTADAVLARELLGLQVEHAPDEMFGVTGVAEDGRFRRVEFAVGFGSLGLMVGTLGQAVSNWGAAVDALRAAMVDVAPIVVSGFVKRGRHRAAAGIASTFEEDWVPTPHIRRGYLMATPRLADRYVPDVFGVQLLGPGHRDRLPDSGRWTVRELDAGRLLVEYQDLAAWYRDAKPTPEVLAEARADFAALLMREEFVRA